MPAQMANGWITSLPAPAGGESQEHTKFQMVEFLATGSGDAQELLDKVERFAHLARASDLAQDKSQYQAWLEEAQQGSMRPLYRTVKSHELVTVRPFGQAEPGLRPYLRFLQWQEIWEASDCEIERIMQASQQRAMEEAKALPVLTGKDFQGRFRSLPQKAPGPDGWNIPVLKALPLQACNWIAEVCRRVEATGVAPAQWTVSLVVLLAKKPQIERPIALCHVVYKIWIKFRYYLVEQWLDGFAARAPWDSARRPWLGALRPSHRPRAAKAVRASPLQRARGAPTPQKRGDTPRKSTNAGWQLERTLGPRRP